MKKRKKCSFHKIISDIDKRLADNIPDYENKKNDLNQHYVQNKKKKKSMKQIKI